MAANTGPLDLSQYISGVTDRAYKNWGRADDQYDWAKKQFEANRAIADKVQQQALDTGRMGMDWATTDRNMYEQQYMPAMQQQLDYARQYTTPERMAANRAGAIAGSNIAFDANADAAKRSLMSYGVDPSSGRYAGLDAGLQAKRAASAAGVGTKSDRDTEMMGQQLLANAIRTGQVLPGQAQNEAGLALAGGRQAADVGLATTASGASTMGTPLQWGQLGNDMYKEWANAAKSETQAGLEGNKLALEQQKQQDSSSSGIGSLIGMGAGILGSIAMPGGGSLAGTLVSSALGGLGGAAKKAEGGMVTRYADGGMADDEESTLPEMFPDEEMAGGDQMVTPDMSPSAGEVTDDVPAMLNEGEFVVPKDVTAWHGEKFFQKLIEKARQEMTNKVAEPEQGPPVQATPMSEPKFTSPGTQAASGGRMQAFQDGGSVYPFEGVGQAIKRGKEWLFPNAVERPNLFPLAEHEEYLRRTGQPGVYQYTPRSPENRPRYLRSPDRQGDPLETAVNTQPITYPSPQIPPGEVTSYNVVQEPMRRRRIAYEEDYERNPGNRAQAWLDYKNDMRRLDPTFRFPEEDPGVPGIHGYQEGGVVPGYLPEDNTDLAPPFNPEEDDYDYRTARVAGIHRGRDGHMESRDPVTGMMLKGRRHPSFDQAVEEDRKLGYGLEMRNGRYYTVPFQTGGRVRPYGRPGTFGDAMLRSPPSQNVEDLRSGPHNTDRALDAEASEFDLVRRAMREDLLRQPPVFNVEAAEDKPWLPPAARQAPREEYQQGGRVQMAERGDRRYFDDAYGDAGPGEYESLGIIEPETEGLYWRSMPEGERPAGSGRLNGEEFDRSTPAPHKFRREIWRRRREVPTS